MATVKEKIKKLLALATSSNENEAKAALLKAKELMAKNKMSQYDIDDDDQKLRQIMVNDVQWTTDSGKIWMVELCRVLCENYMCSSAWNTPAGSRTHTLIVAGIGEDADICVETIKYAVDCINSKTRYLKRKYRSSMAIENSYAKGFIMGLEIAFEAQKEEHPEWGLVIVKPDEVNEFEKSLGSKNVKTKRTEFNPMAYASGQNDGMNFNTKRAING